jgi:hypothetical protein
LPRYHYIRGPKGQATLAIAAMTGGNSYYDALPILPSVQDLTLRANRYYLFLGGRGGMRIDRIVAEGD